MQHQPDITLVKKELDWEPHMALEEGLKKTIEYFNGVILHSHLIRLIRDFLYSLYI